MRVSRRAASRAALAGALLAAAACATAPCEPVTVTVADKKEYGRLDTAFRGYRTAADGRLEEVREPVPVREYWVKGDDGTWYPVSPDSFRAAEPGQPIRVCR